MSKTIGITKLTPKEKVLKLAEKCEKCGHCCNMDSGTVLKHEVKELANHMDMSEEDFKKKYLQEQEKFNTKHFKFKQIKGEKPYGRCVFLKDNNTCSIHKAKPLHCRIGNCNEYGEALSIWFALNHFVNADDPESIRQWAVYLKTHPTIPGGHLEELVPDKEKLKEILDYEVFR